MAIRMNKTMIIVALVLLTVMLTVGTLAYDYHIANARKLIGANHIIPPHTTNCHDDVCKLIGANHISTSHTTSCDGNVCHMLVCINNKCHGSISSQGSNSTIPSTDDDQ
jgi:hypothetical protein